MDKEVILKIMESKIRMNWGFDKIYENLIMLEDYEKLNQNKNES